MHMCTWIYRERFQVFVHAKARGKIECSGRCKSTTLTHGLHDNSIHRRMFFWSEIKIYRSTELMNWSIAIIHQLSNLLSVSVFHIEMSPLIIIILSLQCPFSYSPIVTYSPCPPFYIPCYDVTQGTEQIVNILPVVRLYLLAFCWPGLGLHVIWTSEVQP